MKCHFPHPFSDLEVVTKRNITCLHKTEIMWSLERLKQQQKYFLKSISNSHITLSLFLHLEWKRRTHILIHNRSSFVNHTPFQTGPDTRFQNKTGQKPYPLGRHKPLLYGLFTGVPPPPPTDEGLMGDYRISLFINCCMLENTTMRIPENFTYITSSQSLVS